MKKTVVILIIITLCTKVLGFIRDITLSYFYGTSNISDAYLISDSIPIIIIALIGTSLATIYIPMYTKIESMDSSKAADRFTNNIVTFIMLISTLIIVICLFFTKLIVKLFASGFEDEILELAVSFTRIGIFGIYFSCLVYIYSGYLQFKGKFLVTSLLGIPYNIIVITSIFLSTKISSTILPIGGVLAEAAKFLFLVPFLFKYGYKYEFVFDRRDHHLKHMIFLAFPVIFGVSVDQINLIVDRTLASNITIGGISSLTFANRITLLIHGVFVISLATVVYPKISKLAIKGQMMEFKELLINSICMINLLVIPSTAVFMVFSESIVKFLYGRGAFDNGAISMTSEVLFYYSIGIIAVGLREILSRAFFSIQDTKTPMVNAIIALIVNIFLNIILSKYMGIAGIALATSLSTILCTFLLFIKLQKKVGRLNLREIFITFIKITITSTLMAVLIKEVNEMIIEIIGFHLSLLFSIFIGIIFFSILIFFMKIREINSVLSLIKIKINSNN